MDEAPPPVVVITGQLAAGKSTVAKALLDRFPRGLHVDVDGIREMVTSGLASPLAWNDETTRQFGLAIRASAAMARIYGEQGFAVAIEGGLDLQEVERALAAEGLAGRFVGVVLHPPIEIALRRNRQRTHKAFDTAILEEAMHEIDQDLTRDGDRPGWHSIDNGEEPVDRTVERILSIVR